MSNILGLNKGQKVFVAFKVVGSVSGNCLPTEYVLSNGTDTIRCTGKYIHDECIVEDDYYSEAYGTYEDDFQWPDDDDLVFYEDEVKE